MAAMLIEFEHHFLVALILFAAASVTDLIDGKMARKHNLITDFGKFLDPLADKMLTTAAFLGFIELQIGHGITWIAFIVLLREFLITSLRLISSGKGKVIAANMWGKCKTVSQMFAIVFQPLFPAQYNTRGRQSQKTQPSATSSSIIRANPSIEPITPACP